MQPFHWKAQIQLTKLIGMKERVLQIGQGLAKIADGLVILLSFGQCTSNIELTITSYRMYRIFAAQQQTKELKLAE